MTHLQLWLISNSIISLQPEFPLINMLMILNFEFSEGRFLEESKNIISNGSCLCNSYVLKWLWCSWYFIFFLSLIFTCCTKKTIFHLTMLSKLQNYQKCNSTFILLSNLQKRKRQLNITNINYLNKNYYVVRNAGFARSRFTLKLSLREAWKPSEKNCIF